MNTEKTQNSQNIASANPQHSESKKELNQKTSVEFSVSVVLGVVLIILLAATAYFGIAH